MVLLQRRDRAGEVGPGGVHAGAQLCAALAQQVGEPVALGVSLLGEAAEVHVGRLGGGEQAPQQVRAQGGIRVAGVRRVPDVGYQPLVGGERRDDHVVGPRIEVGDEALD